jgi:hypothetical protein
MVLELVVLRGLRFGFGRMFGLLFLFRHPVFLVVVLIAVVALAVYLHRRRR